MQEGILPNLANQISLKPSHKEEPTLCSLFAWPPIKKDFKKYFEVPFHEHVPIAIAIWDLFNCESMMVLLLFLLYSWSNSLIFAKHVSKLSRYLGGQPQQSPSMKLVYLNANKPYDVKDACCGKSQWSTTPPPMTRNQHSAMASSLQWNLQPRGLE